MSERKEVSQYGAVTFIKEGQATKGSRWIPRHTEAKKDAVTSDMLWGVGSRH